MKIHLVDASYFDTLNARTQRTIRFSTDLVPGKCLCGDSVGFGWLVFQTVRTLSSAGLTEYDICDECLNSAEYGIRLLQKV